MIRNNVQQNTNTAGAGAYTLSGLVTTKGVVPFATACVSGKKYRYKVEAINGTDFEINEGTFTSPSTLTRDRLIQSSTGGPIAWPDASAKVVSLVALAEDFGPEGGRHSYLIGGGTAAAYTGSSDVLTPVLVAGMRVRVKIPVTNSGACTYNHNGLGAKAIKKRGVTLDPEPGELPADLIAELVYEAVADVWQVMNPCVHGSLGVKVVSTTTYTILAADVGKLLVFTNVAGCAVALPQATGAFVSPWWVEMQNAAAANVVVTPTTSTIDGAATLTIAPNTGAEIRSDSTNYRARRDYVAAPKIPVRQTVLSGPVDVNGLPAFGGATGSTVVTMAGTLRVTAANGFDANGQVDRVGSIANASWTGLSTNGTMYLFLDIAADGICTPGATVLAPTYRFGGADVVTNGQFTFNVQEMIGKVGNGATAAQAYRVFVGEVTVAGAVVTAITWYALMGRYVSSWTATLPTTAIAVTVLHNLGTKFITDTFSIELECTTADLAHVVGDILINPGNDISTGYAVSPMPYRIISALASVWTTGTASPWKSNSRTAGGTWAALTLASWKYRTRQKRGW